MLAALKNRYRVDNVPWFLKPPYLVYRYGLGLVLRFCFLALYYLNRVETVGQEHLDAHPNRILALWHGKVGIMFVGFPKGFGDVALNHPYWYMAPIHRAIELAQKPTWIWGSTGSGGRAAADQVVEYLKDGSSTFINPDGPSGPPQQLKKGALHIAAQSGVPILPIRLTATRTFRLNGWDRKEFPLPFGKIKIEYRPLIFVNYDNFEESAQRLQSELG